MNNNSFLKTVLPLCDILLLLVTVLIIMIMLVRVENKKQQEAAYQQSAAYLIILTWEGKSDLDLWVQDPEGHKVGFSRREGGEGSMLSLNRDCLGSHRTEVNAQGEVLNKVNEEIVAIRGIAPGEFIVNVHAYHLDDAETIPLKAKVKLVRIKQYQEAKTADKEFQQTGEELTYFRFTLDKSGAVTDVNDLPTSILRDGNQTSDSEEPQSQP